MSQPLTITYRRRGRSKRAFGTILDCNNGLTKVKPSPASWKSVWLTAEEMAAGSAKAPIQAKSSQKKGNPAKKRERKHKTTPMPRWKQLVERIRIYEIDHHPEECPAVQMKTLSALADELEQSMGLFGNAKIHGSHADE